MSNPHSTSPVILFVDDEAATTKYFQLAINSLAPVVIAGSVEEGKQVLDAHAGSLLILVSDQRMPGEYGNELLRYAKERYPHIIRILATAYSELDNTVEAINEGQIHRYLKKPLDLASLRIELRQVLDFAYLRKERDELVREKLMVRHNQIIAHRIGALYSLCLGLDKPAPLQSLDTYLTAALSAGVTPPEPDWLLMDYSDLISAEAKRIGEFNHAVHGKAAELEVTYKSRPDTDAITVLSELLGNNIQVISQDTAIFTAERHVAEFLETPSSSAVSLLHITWFSFLIWLARQGGKLDITKREGSLQCQATKATTDITPLATWIEQF